MSVRGVIVEYDFAAIEGAEILFNTTRTFLSKLDGIAFDNVVEARYLAGGNYQGGLADYFAVVKTKKTAQKAARDLSAAFVRELNARVAQPLAPAFVNFVRTLAEKGLKVRQGELLAAAIPSNDPDLAKIGGGSTLPVLALCNPDDITLRYVYAIAGGEDAVAFGANGTLKPIENVKECVLPSEITKQVKIDRDWGKVQAIKNIANHSEFFYIEYLRRLLSGEEASGEVMVPQALPTVEGEVMDSGLWWDTLAETNGWKLQRNKVTGHGRIINPQKVRKAWGTVEEMALSFEKVRNQL